MLWVTSVKLSARVDADLECELKARVRQSDADELMFGFIKQHFVPQ